MPNCVQPWIDGAKADVTNSSMTNSTEKAPRKPGNLRTALVLGSIAAVFFAGVIINRWLFG
jgi:hypothetical protein